MDIIIEIHVYPIWGMNIDSKENGGKKCLFGKTKASLSFIPMRKNVFMVPNHEKKEDYYMYQSLS